VFKVEGAREASRASVALRGSRNVSAVVGIARNEVIEFSDGRLSAARFSLYFERDCLRLSPRCRLIANCIAVVTRESYITLDILALLERRPPRARSAYRRLSIQCDRRSLSLSRAELVNPQDERPACRLARDGRRLTEKEESRSRASEPTF